jgi:hypothetical protein
MLFCVSTPKRRRGLAPLELVLALPFLLGIMALMVCLANVACWKVRALTVARHTLWGNMSPDLWSPWVHYDRKTGNLDPSPAYWPENGTSENVGGAGNAAGNVDDPRINLPVVRGPTFQQLEVNTNLLDPAREIRRGSANLTRPFPMLKSMGRFHTRAETYSLDDAWRAAEMGIPNEHFRFAILYPNFRPPTGTNPVLMSMLAIYNSIQQGRLDLLYGTDSDFKKFEMLYGVPPPSPPLIDRIPGWTRLHFQCEMDPDIVQQGVDDLVDRIQGSQKRNGPLMRLTNDLIGYYRSVQGVIEALLQDETLPPQRRQQLQSDLNIVTGYIKALQDFRRSL